MTLTTGWFQVFSGRARVMRTDFTVTPPYSMCAVRRPDLPPNVVRLERHALHRVLLTQELCRMDLED